MATADRSDSSRSSYTPAVRPTTCAAISALTLLGLAACSNGSAKPAPVAPGGPAPEASVGGWRQDAISLGATSTPAVVGDVALVGLGVDGTSLGSAALDARTGRVLWQVHDKGTRDTVAGVSTRPIGFVTPSGPVAVEVETDTEDRARLVSRAAGTGAVLWSRALPIEDNDAAFRSPIACGPDICLGIATSGSPVFESVDPFSGKERWRQTGRGEAIARPVYSGRGEVVVQSQGSNLTAYATADGRQMWTITRPDLTNLGAERDRTGGGPSWYVLGDTLIGSGDPHVGSSALTGIDLRSGAVRWTHAGWAFAGAGQPTLNDDGVTLADGNVLAFESAGNHLAAIGPDGQALWSVRSGRFGRFRGGASIGWTANLGQVWLADIPGVSEGRTMSSGALVRTGNRNPLIWIPSDQPGGRARGEGYVDLRFVHGEQPGASDPDPAWAGSFAGGLRLRVDRSGSLFARRAG